MKNILELARLSGFNEYANDDGADDENLTKFAELIVTECLTQVDKADAASEDDSEKIGIATVGYAIAKHFGVE